MYFSTCEQKVLYNSRLWKKKKIYVLTALICFHKDVCPRCLVFAVNWHH